MSEFFWNALKSGNKEALIQLLNEEPSLANLRDINGSHPIQVAVYFGKPELAHFLEARGAKLDLFCVSAMGDEDAVQSWISAQPEQINSVSPDGFTPLCLASSFGHKSAVEALLDAGASPDYRSKAMGGCAPLDLAVFNRHFGIAKLLLKAGADPNSRQVNGFAPLHAAARNGDVHMIELLIGFGANPKVTNNRGETASEVARKFQHTQAVQLLTA